MAPVKKPLPVYDICSLHGTGSLHELIIAEHFADYLKVHPNLYQAHGHSFYHLVLFTKGGGYHTIDFRHYPVQTGEAYFMVPGQVHSWSFEGEVDGYVINFSEVFFQSFLSDAQLLERFRFFSEEACAQVVYLEQSVQQQASTILEQVVQELQQSAVFQQEQLRLLLLQFFILVERALPAEEKASDRKNSSVLVLQQFRKLVQQYYQQYKLPKDYAAMLYVTPNYLNALCKDLLGKSAGELIRERVLLEARRQLVNLDEGIAGIGYNLGFSDNSYFSKFFRKYTGQSPEDFRREIQATSTLKN